MICARPHWLFWVGDSAILAVPSELPDVAYFPAALSNAPVAQVPESRCESGGGARPLGSTKGP